jgi:hypothetical protein
MGGRAADLTTLCLFRDDPYLTEAAATVLEVDKRGGIILDKTVFYVTGGGQPGDCGVLNLRTESRRIFNSAVRAGLRRQPIDLAVHPGGSNCCTCAAATWPGVAHAQNSKWSFLVALTTYTTSANPLFMSVLMPSTALMKFGAGE